MGGILGQTHPAVSSINVGSLLSASESKVSRVLGGMEGSSILGRPWLCLRMETVNVGGGGAASSDSHIQMLAASLMPHQAPQRKHCGAPGEQISGTCEQTSPAVLSAPPRTHCSAHDELGKHGMEATHGTNSTKAVTRKTQPPSKA